MPAALAAICALLGVAALVLGRRGLKLRDDGRGVVGLGMFVGGCALLAGFFAFNAIFYWVAG